MKVILPATAAIAALLSSCSNQGTPGDNRAASNGATDANVVNGATDTPAQILARLFQAADLNGSGTLTRPEGTTYMDSIMISKDTDDDGSLTLAEFQQWDAGFLAIAQAHGVAAKYNDEKAAIFKRWDANGDRRLEFDEFHAGIGKDFAAVPTQQQGRMTEKEFANVAFLRDMAAASVDNGGAK